jgi:hypothetical protein
MGRLHSPFASPKEAVMDRTGANGSPDRGSASKLRESLAPLTTELAAAVAATPEPDRERVIAEIGRAIRSEVRAVDEMVRNHFRSRPVSTDSVAASTRRPSRKVRVGLEDLEGRAVPSIITITVTNHPSAQVQRTDPAVSMPSHGMLAAEGLPFHQR